MSSPTSPSHSASRASLHLLSALLVPAVALAACIGGTTPAPATPSPTASTSATPVASASPSATDTLAPSASPSVSVVPSLPTTCATSVNEGVAPSDRLVRVKVDAGVGADTITFTFGKTSGQPSGTDPTGELRPTAPPFSLSGSGQAVDVKGQRFIAVTFRGMAVSDAQGNPTYTGAVDIHANLVAIQELRLVDDFEGVVTWLVGVNGPGCITVTHLTGPDRIVVAIAQL
jgi:hypothetical protein